MKVGGGVGVDGAREGGRLERHWPCARRPGVMLAGSRFRLRAANEADEHGEKSYAVGA